MVRCWFCSAEMLGRNTLAHDCAAATQAREQLAGARTPEERFAVLFRHRQGERLDGCDGIAPKIGEVFTAAGRQYVVTEHRPPRRGDLIHPGRGRLVRTWVAREPKEPHYIVRPLDEIESEP